MRYHFYGRSRDTYGNVVQGVDVSIYLAGTQTAASVYAAKTGGTAISTAPQVTTNANGLFDFWVDDVDYALSTLFDIVVGDITYSEFDIFREVNDHGLMTGLGDDDHTQYMTVSASRSFTAPVSGQAPTLGSHLATKTYVDAVSGGVITDHGSLAGLGDDDHTQYMPVNASRTFTSPVSGQSPARDEHLTTKGYADLRDTYIDAGVLNYVEPVDNNDGTFSILQTQDVLLYNNSIYQGNLEFFTIPSGTFSVSSSGQTEYFVVDYSIGTPAYKVTTNLDSIEWSSVIPHTTLYLDRDNKYHFLDWGSSTGLAERLVVRMVKTERFARESGLVLTTNGLQVNISSGRIWNGTARSDLDAVDSTIDDWYFYFHSGGTFTRSTTTTGANNTQWDDGTNLVSLSAGYYNVNWIYRNEDEIAEGYILLDDENHATIASAEAARVPTDVPDIISSACILVGRIIYQNGVNTPVETESAFDVTFTPSVAFDHGQLAGLGDDDHVLYTKADGSRAFTGTVVGITPTLDAHLSTKGYVDGEISAVSGGVITDHGGLSGLGDDDHTQYMPVNASRSFTSPVSGQTPNLGSHLTTKTYVDTQVSTVSGAIATDNIFEGDSKVEVIDTGVDSKVEFTLDGVLRAELTSGGFDIKSSYFIDGGKVLSTDGTTNLFAGSGSGFSNTTGSSNTFVGDAAGYFNTTGTGNTFLGRGSGSNNLSGDDNVIIGAGTAFGYSTTDLNVIIGNLAAAGGGGASAARNVIVGYSAGFTTTSASNTFVGTYAGYLNTSGGNNTCVGDSAGYYSSTGSSNVVIGREAGFGSFGNSHSSNTIMGYRAGYLITIGGNNTIIGKEASYSITSGFQNTNIGSNAGYHVTTGSNSVCVGYRAGFHNETGTNDTLVGFEAGFGATGNSHSNNVFMGYQAGYSITTGASNVAIGGSSCSSNTTGATNTALGRQSLNFNQTGSSNVVIGFRAGYGQSANSYSNNVFIGHSAGFSTTTGGNNVSMGYRAGYSTTTGGNNVSIGYQAGYSNNTGMSNIFIGYQAGYFETGSNKLYIENSDSSTPLISGDFSTDIVGINGELVTNNIRPNIDSTYTLGTSSNRWSEIHLSSKIFYDTSLEFEDSSGEIRDMAEISPVLFDTSPTPPSSAGLPNGTLYFQYTA